MCRRIARAIVAAAAAGATVAVFGLMVAGTAGAATRPAPLAYHSHAAGTAGPATVVSRNIAGYATALSEAWRFRSVIARVPVAACKLAPSKNPVATVQLVGGTKWAAEIAVFCNGGAGSIVFFDQKNATTHVQGAFRLAPSAGGLLRVSISRNVAAHVDSFTATNVRTGRSQTVRVTTSTAVVYHHAFLGSAVSSNLNVLPLPAATTPLWSFQNIRVITYGGSAGGVRGPWAAVTVIDRTSGGLLVMFPGPLSPTATAFSTFLSHA